MAGGAPLLPLVRAMSDGGNGARLNRAALGRAVRYLAGRGVAQFLDLGSGLTG